jgi:hypothetical protein
MKIAKATDMEIKALPANTATIQLDRTFSFQEMDRIRRGLLPEQMEDKWFIYWNDDTLFFHRSWTGFCIYVVHFVTDNEGCRMIKAEVNRDPEQYREINDIRDVELISYLIDVLLLHQEAVFPSDEESPEKRSLIKWSFVGRAMLGEHPNDE